MRQEDQPTNLLAKLLRHGALALLVAILALAWSIHSSQSQKETTERQMSNQATQLAKQDVQIGLIAEQNRLLYERATVDAQQARIESQLQTPFASNNEDFAITATALSLQADLVEATRQVIEAKQQRVEATQTSVARSQTTPIATSLPRRAPAGAFTVADANEVVLSSTCDYWTPDLALYSDGTGNDRSSVRKWDLAALPSGFIIGDAMFAEIDGHLLGNSGVTFMIRLAEPQARQELSLRDGAFFIVSSENADGFLRLRVRHLECRGTNRAVVYYP